MQFRELGTCQEENKNCSDREWFRKGSTKPAPKDQAQFNFEGITSLSPCINFGGTEMGEKERQMEAGICHFHFENRNKPTKTSRNLTKQSSPPDKQATSNKNISPHNLHPHLLM